MKITFLGTGTSAVCDTYVGVPVTCLSDDPRDKRRRASLLIDASTDLGQQALRSGLDKVDAALFTHADHCFGLDGLHLLMSRHGAIACFASR
jgi:phosphoribosyl 1,2-cyclic phosphate phosphodiesterase